MAADPKKKDTGKKKLSDVTRLVKRVKKEKVTSIGNSTNTRYNKKGTKKKSVGQG